MAASAETLEWDVTVPLVIQVFVFRLLTSAAAHRMNRAEAISFYDRPFHQTLCGDRLA